MDIINNETSLIELVKKLQKEIISRKWAEKRACDALDYAESIIDSVQSPLIVLDDEYKIVSANIPFFELFALSVEESIGMKFFEFHNGIFDIELLKKAVTQDKDSNQSIELFQDFKLLGEKYLQVKCVNLQYNVKHLKFKLVIINDITDFINNQNILKKAIDEKQFLITEVQHRIKNNLFVIENLLKLEFETLKSEESKNAFQLTINRIHSIGLLYEKLYRAKDLGKISIIEYLPGLIQDIKNIFMSNISIIIDEDTDDIILDGQILFPLGLITNELITNSMKYAFADCNNGMIKVSAKKIDNKVKFTISDNGKGFSNSLDNTNAFGLQLIEILTEQIKGKITYEHNLGTTCILEFVI